MIDSASARETAEAGEEIAGRLTGGDVVLLRGELGAGKTTFAQGIARGLGVAGPVQSPTFTLVAEYDAPAIGRHGQFVHVDLYRLDGAVEIDTVGLEQYFDREDVVTVIEWPERAPPALFPVHWSVDIASGEDDRRRISIREPGDE